MERLFFPTFASMQKNPDIKSVSLIGAGNVGTHLVRALYTSGIHIDCIYSRKKNDAERLASEVSSRAVGSLSEIDESTDLIILCVKDDSIKEVAEGLVDHPAILVHTSGSVDMKALSNRRGTYGIIYPLQTFTKDVEMIYNNIPFFLEASNEITVQALEDLAGKISPSVYKLDSEGRTKIHLASVFACNFSNHMAAIASKILEKEGLKLEMIMPLLEQTFNKLKTSDPVSAQTGPAVRNDSVVMQKHLDMLLANPKEQEL